MFYKSQDNYNFLMNKLNLSNFKNLWIMNLHRMHVHCAGIGEAMCPGICICTDHCTDICGAMYPGICKCTDHCTGICGNYVPWYMYMYWSLYRYL